MAQEAWVNNGGQKGLVGSVTGWHERDSSWNNDGCTGSYGAVA